MPDNDLLGSRISEARSCGTCLFLMILQNKFEKGDLFISYLPERLYQKEGIYELKFLLGKFKIR